MASGPLDGIRIIEIAGIGPGPFAGFMLADLGADIIKIDRSDRAHGGDPATPPADVLQRGRRSIGVDLKSPEGVDVVLDLVEKADGLFEPFRPGVTERLGIGPDVCMARNPKLVYGRMTGWGQDGPYAHTAGHDINYISLAGALFHFGRKDQPPTFPMNMVGDFGGGGMLLAYGMLAGLLHAARTGEGQVVDAAMVDGTAALMMMFHAFRAMGIFDEVRGDNLLDSAAHFYDVYECAEGEYVSIGSIEPQFYAELLKYSGLAEQAQAQGEELPWQMDKSQWPAMKARLAAIFKSKTRDEWCEVMEGTDVCFAPVLRMSEAARHPHNVHRQTFIEREGIIQPAPAPRFSVTPGEVQRPPAHVGQHTDEVLAEWLGVDADRIAKLRASGAVA
jgi:alpha-methylacyl-CoA racemase